jgi:hypothetical protein
MADDGSYFDEFGQEITPPGTRINGVPPTATAAPTPGSGNWTTLSRGGPITINTPNSSSGQPFRQAPSASTYQSSFAQPQGGQLTTTTPNSRTGAPAPGIRNYFNPMLTGLTNAATEGVAGSVLAAPSLVGPTYGNGPIDEQMKNAIAADNAERQKALNFWQHPFGFTNPLATQSPAAAPAPITQTGPLSQSRGVAVPPFPPSPPPPGPPGAGPPLPPPRPMVAAPFPVGAPQGAVPRAPQSYNLGYGGGTPAAAAPPAAPSPMFTTIDRPNADIVGGPTRPGYLSADPHEPGGPARMGALDLSGLFNHPAVAAAAAAHPAVQGALAAQNAQAQQAPRARAPVVQQKWALPQLRPGGAANAKPTYYNPAYGVGANVGMGN